MKLIKFLAILSAVILFESFFIIGIRLTQPEEQIKYVYLNQEQQPHQIIKVTQCPFNESGKSITVFGVGVHDDNKTGELIDINMKIKPGEGKIYFDTSTHAFGSSIQDSIPLIIYNTEKKTNFSLNNEDLYIDLDSISHEIDGTSASATMAVGLIALLENKQVNNSIVMTGSLSKTGRITIIDGLDVKIKVAEQKGIEEILVPKQQCNEIPENVSINVKCVSNLDEALNSMVYWIL